MLDKNIFVAISSAGFAFGVVWRSTDNGTTWADIGLQIHEPLELVISGADILAATDNGVFVSTNNGTSWTAMRNGLTNLYVRTLAVSGTDLFAGTYHGGIFHSTNGGMSWTEANVG
jgi:photosystem II stability/assembly factor-like uncharacterized protein